MGADPEHPPLKSSNAGLPDDGVAPPDVCWVREWEQREDAAKVRALACQLCDPFISSILPKADRCARAQPAKPPPGALAANPFAATNGYKLTEVLWAKSAAEALNAPEPSL